MRRRKRSIAPWVLLFIGILFLVATICGGIVFAARHAWLPTTWNIEVLERLDQAIASLPDDESRKTFLWIGSITFAAISTAITFLATWHFLEMNLPRRIEELKDYHSEDHLALRPQLVALGRRTLWFIPADIESSRLTLLRRWWNRWTWPDPADIQTGRFMLLRRLWSRWSVAEKAKLLAATTTRLDEEATALSAAAREAQHQTITAYVIRGYQYVGRGENERAFTEFELATRVSAKDIYSRDIAAGWARCTNNQTRELELLGEIRNIARESRSTLSYIHEARALRRQAEVIAKRNNNRAYVEALDPLRVAQNILETLVADGEARLELGRTHTLFCELRCNLRRPGHLDGQNQPLTRMREYMDGVEMHTREEEPCGEQYGAERAERVGQRVAALVGDDSGGQSGETNA